MTADTPRRRGRPRKVTASSLENAALHYLERFASSAQNLRRVLMRRVERSAREHDTSREEGAALVDALIERYAKSGLIDDARYAANRARSLARRGDSPRAIRAKLAQKGVSAEAIQGALGELAEESADPTFSAAVALARRRRLGPFRPAELRAAFRDKDLAAFARAGFPYDVARQVLDAADPDELEPG